MDPYYPPVGFQFEVAFEGFSRNDRDTRFQVVSGLQATVEQESVREGGENRFTHSLPTGVSYSDLQLKRGLVTNSELLSWCRAAIEDFVFKPLNLTVSLLDETQQPVAVWQVVHAYPVFWEVSEFDAAQSRAVIETLKLKYRYFRVRKG